MTLYIRNNICPLCGSDHGLKENECKVCGRSEFDETCFDGIKKRCTECAQKAYKLGNVEAVTIQELVNLCVNNWEEALKHYYNNWFYDWIKNTDEIKILEEYNAARDTISEESFYEFLLSTGYLKCNQKKKKNLFDQKKKDELNRIHKLELENKNLADQVKKVNKQKEDYKRQLDSQIDESQSRIRQLEREINNLDRNKTNEIIKKNEEIQNQKQKIKDLEEKKSKVSCPYCNEKKNLLKTDIEEINKYCSITTHCSKCNKELLIRSSKDSNSKISYYVKPPNCKKCHTQLDFDSKFCGKCGQEVK